MVRSVLESRMLFGCSPGPWPRPFLAALLLCGLSVTAIPAAAQVDFEEPLLPEVISEHDAEMRGRYARQWKQTDGTLVILFTSGFRLDMGQRRLSANSAVVWITPRRTEPENRKYYELVVYLSENASVQEFGGTTIEDRVLVVSNLQTYGRIIKYHDAHSPEVGEKSPLYQQALRDRLLLDATILPEPAPRQPVEVVHPAEAEIPKTERPPQVIRFELPSIEPAETADGLPVLVAKRDTLHRVYFSRAGSPDAPMLEILADNAVVFPAEGFASGIAGRETAGQASQVEVGAGDQTEEAPARLAEQGGRTPSLGLKPHGLERSIRAVYLEGDVVLSLGTSFVRASRLYYDFERDRALILDAVFRADIPDRNIPLYIRADEIRQLSAREFSAENAQVTTSEFHTPHYHIGAERIYLRDLTERDVVWPLDG